MKASVVVDQFTIEFSFNDEEIEITSIVDQFGVTWKIDEFTKEEQDEIDYWINRKLVYGND